MDPLPPIFPALGLLHQEICGVTQGTLVCMASALTADLPLHPPNPNLLNKVQYALSLKCDPVWFAPLPPLFCWQSLRLIWTDLALISRCVWSYWIHSDSHYLGFSLTLNPTNPLSKCLYSVGFIELRAVMFLFYLLCYPPNAHQRAVEIRTCWKKGKSRQLGLAFSAREGVPFWNMPGMPASEI